MSAPVLDPPAQAARAAVAAHAVTKRHGTGAAAVDALRGVSLALAPGELLAVMGPSGSGKSTLMHLLAGLDRPDSGSVLVDGVELGRLSERELSRLRRDRIGFVFQAFNLLPTLTAAENVALPLRLAGREPDPGVVEEALARVGLADRARHRPSELSGGQQQRVAVARALVTEPAVVLADEPTGNLDTRSSHAILALLREAVDVLGQAVALVTHDPVAAAVADRVVFLADGLVVADEPGLGAAEILDRMKELA